ncbi:hypothetical protein ACH40E_05500 [Streptomyces acidicola]|uniref:hypothetical protein n=1 Tax=Streptomyces acidicola TaxID=2596892 RepID=UPI0037A94A4E
MPEIAIPDDVPSGPLRDYLLWLRQLHKSAGYPSSRELAKSLGPAHTTVTRLFKGYPSNVRLAYQLIQHLAENPLRPVVRSEQEWDRFYDTAARMLEGAKTQAVTQVESENLADITPDTCAVTFHRIGESDLVDQAFAVEAGSLLAKYHELHDARISSSFFTVIMERGLKAQGHNDLRVPPGHPYSLFGGGQRWLLKTFPERSTGQVVISKLSEAPWLEEVDSVEDCILGARRHVAEDIDSVDRILAMKFNFDRRGVNYDLVEVPTNLLKECIASATASHFSKNRHGFLGVFNRPDSREEGVRMRFDRSVQKVGVTLQVKHCIHHGSWVVPNGTDL